MKKITLFTIALSFLTLSLLFSCRPKVTEQTKSAATPNPTGPNAPTVKASFQVPEGFAVEQIATSEQIGSVVNMTFDSKGRPVLSQERGPIVLLEDADKDGKYEAKKTFTDFVTNCHGLYFIGNALYAVGDVPTDTKATIKGSDELKQEFEAARQANLEEFNSPENQQRRQPDDKPRGVTGLYRVEDNNGDDVGDDVKIIGLVKGGIGEHGPHAVMIGPDGLMYFVIGNHAWPTISSEPLAPHVNFYEGQLIPNYMDARGHARNIRAPGGTIWRLDHEGESWERVAGGFRNEFDAGFNLMGELFTFDSDMEWDINLPWYRGCRTVHVVPGGDYGWRTGSGKWPNYNVDSLPEMNDMGRGSPVGIDVYQHNNFPAKYHDAVFMGDWSRGRIIVALPKKEGATYKSEIEDFVLGEPLNVTDLVVGPDGAIWFVNGGRSTDGGLFRVSYKSDVPPAGQKNAVDAALTQPQPRSAWGRAAIKKLHDENASNWESGLQAVVKNAGDNAERRVRALELLQVYGAAPTEEMLTALGKDATWEMRAASTYYLGLHATETARKELAGRLKDSDPFVRRRACEALIRTGIHPAMKLNFSPTQDVMPLLNDADRNVRYAARLVLERTNRNKWRNAVLREAKPEAAITGLLAAVRTMSSSLPEIDELLDKEIALLKGNLSTEQKLALLRVIHLTLINDEGVQRPRKYDPIGTAILGSFPTSEWQLNREYARTLAHLQTPGAIEKIVAELNKEKDQAQQIFYMYCLRNIKGDWKPESQESIAQWFAKTQKEGWKGGASYTGYLELMWNSWLGNLKHEDKVKAEARLKELAPAAVAAAGDFANKAGNKTISNQELSEYLLLDPMSYRMTPTTIEDGQKAFEKASCVTCHRFGDLGIEVGPDLTDVGKRFKRKDLIEAILYPSKTISDLWQAAQITTTDGKSYFGVVESQDASQVTIRLVTKEKVNIPVSQIKTREAAKVSLMPENLLNNLNVQEAAALMMFLEKGAGNVPKK